MDAHALAWTRILNNPQAEGELQDLVVVAAYPGGSPDIPQSMQLLEKAMQPIRHMNVEIVDSISQLVKMVDAVMILSIDGRTHLQQARPVIAAGKPLFIDKPLAASLSEARQIFALAEQGNTPCFSSSALRFSPGTQELIDNPAVGRIRGCDAFSPCPLEPHHPDFFWYGIHGVETLFTVMGPGCKTASRTHSDDDDVAIGVWSDGRIGTFRGTRKGPHSYGATVFGDKQIAQAGRFEGYEPLLVEIVKFFKTGVPPVPAAHTLEILAFMEAADASRRQGGATVPLEDVMTGIDAP
jgi:predicted dehydrogenase